MFDRDEFIDLLKAVVKNFEDLRSCGSLMKHLNDWAELVSDPPHEHDDAPKPSPFQHGARLGGDDRRG